MCPAQGVGFRRQALHCVHGQDGYDHVLAISNVEKEERANVLQEVFHAKR